MRLNLRNCFAVRMMVMMGMVCLTTQALAGVVPVPSPFYAGAEQTDARMIYVGAGDSGGRLAIDNHADFMVARNDRNVALNWCNGGTFKWSFGFFGFDGPESDYPLFQPDVNGSAALTFDGADKLRMILEPGFGYTLPAGITDGVLSVEVWIHNPSVQAGEVLIRFGGSPTFDLTVDPFKMKGGAAWQHLVAVSDGAKVDHYLNGSRVTTKKGAIKLGGDAVINLGAESFSGSMAAVRVHTEAMNQTDISHNYAGGVALGSYLFYPISKKTLKSDKDAEFWGDPMQNDKLSWHESAHFRSMWFESANPKPDDDIATRVKTKQLPDLEAVYTYLNERSGKHLPLVSNDEAKRGDGRKYKWIVGNGWGGSWSGWCPDLALGFGLTYTGHCNPHEYIHGTDSHQMNRITGQWWETHANFQPSWLGKPHVNPVTCSPKHAHVYPSTGGNYYHAYLIFDHLLETPEFGGLYVTRLWNRGPKSGKDGTTFPPKGMAEMDPSPESSFNEEWVKMAARNITWDYPRHPEYASVYSGLKYMTRKHYTLLEKVPYRSACWYEPPKWRTPQQHGYNIAPLEVKAGTVTADIDGFIDEARGSDWTAMFVAVDGRTPRYGDIFTAAEQGRFKVRAEDDELYLVVVATPTNILAMGIFGHEPLTDYRLAPKDRFPYRVQLGGTTPKASLWRPTAAIKGKVDPTAYVAPTAYIDSGAKVLGHARVEDYAQVYGTVQDNVIVSGHATIESNAVVKDHAQVRDYAIIRNGVIVSGDARVLEHADILGAMVYDFGVCKGNAEVSGPVHGNAIVDGNYIKNGDRDKGYWRLWSWGDGQYTGELDKDFAGLFLEYQFEKKNGYRVWDTHGITWARLINGASYATDHDGSVLELNGKDQFVDLHTSVAVAANDVSYVVDVKWDGGAKGQRIFEFSNPNGNVCWLSPSDDQGKLSFGITIDGDTQVVRAAKPLPTGQWKTVTVMSYADTVVLHVDGIEWGRDETFTHDIKDVNGVACTLGRGASGGYFDGRMDNFTVWSRSLIDTIPPQPDPAEFALEPIGVTETEVAMFSRLGSDPGGNVEYRFEETTGGTGADDSGWQSSLRYWDADLAPDASELVYRVTMRDGSGNTTDASAPIRLTRRSFPVYPQADNATGLAVVEAEDFARSSAGIKGGTWANNTSAKGYLGSGAMMASAGGRSYGKDYDVSSPRMDYLIDFAKTGSHWAWVRASGSSPSDDSYHLGLDMHADDWGKYQAWGTWNIYHWMRKGPFTIDKAGVHTINLWMREDGASIDRLLVTSDGDYVPTGEKDGQGNIIGEGPAATTATKAALLSADVKK
ncbi:MAG: hypothetical protein HN919_08065 [Verrucomicrobia bacterium]|nr:hypothetical protein [Verrucomicrobiota bacterium]